MPCVAPGGCRVVNDGFFGERVAAHNDERSASIPRPEATDPVVDLLEAYAPLRLSW